MHKVLLAALFLIPPATAQASWPAPIQPTIDCTAEQLMGSGQCGGTLAPTFTKFGAPTLVGSPYFGPGGEKGAVRFNGSTDYFDAGDVGDQPGSFTGCLRFSTRSVSGSVGLLTKDAGGVDRSFYLSRIGAGIYFWIANAAAQASIIQTATGLGANEWNVVCLSYQYVTNGTSILRMNINGAPVADVTNAYGPMKNTTAPLLIGKGTSGFFDGDMVGLNMYAGWAASNADLARLEASMRQPPLGITHTRNQSQSIVSADGSRSYTGPPNVGMVGQYGLQVYGQRISRVLNNQRVSTATSTGGMLAASWTKRGTASVAAGCVTAPDGSCTADEITVGAVNVDDLYAGTLGFSANAGLTTTFWMQRVSSTGSLKAEATSSGIGSITVDLATAGTGWVRYSGTGTASVAGSSGFKLSAVSGTVAVRIWRPWQVEGAIAGPDAEVGAGAYTALGDSPAAPVALSPGQPWCSTFTGSPDAGVVWGSSANPMGLWGLGASGAANASKAYVLGTKVYFEVTDNASVLKQGWLTHGFAAGTQHTLTFCLSAAGAMTALVDGTPATLTLGGAGTGVMVTQPSSALIGLYVATREFGGAIQKVRFCPNETDPARCEAGTGLKVAPMFSPKRWCVRAKNVTPVGTWSTGSRIPVLGGAWAGANTYGIYTTGGSVVCSIWDMAAAQRYHSVSVPDDSATHTFVCCNNDGVPLLQLDGVTSVYARAGTGSGLMSVMPTTSGPTGTPNLTIESIDWNQSGNPSDF